MAKDLQGDVELLVDDSLDTRGVGGVDDRAHLGAEDTLAGRARTEVIEVRHRLHQLSAIDLIGEAEVDLDDRDDALDVPQIRRRRLTLDVAVHRHLEEDRCDHPVAVERRVGDDARAHRVHEIEHLGVAGVGALIDPVELESLGGAAAALVECGDEALAGTHLGAHVGIHGVISRSEVESSAYRQAFAAGRGSSVRDRVAVRHPQAPDRRHEKRPRDRSGRHERGDEERLRDGDEHEERPGQGEADGAEHQ